MATKPRGGGAKGLSGRATKKRTFFAASLTSFPLFIKTVQKRQVIIKAMPLRETNFFLPFFFDGEVPTAIKLEGGGGLNGTEITFLTFTSLVFHI